MIHSTVLPNGLRVVIAEQPDSPVISAGVFVRQGSRNESEGDNGISHFLEHLIFNTQRAIKRGKRAVAEIVDNGGILCAYTTKECTSFEAIALKQHAKLVFQALYQLVFEPDFTDEDVDIERQVILAELRRKLSTSDQMMDYLMQGIYAHSGYGNWILGTEHFISTVRMELLKQRYEEIYVADNCAVVVVTSLDVREIVATIQELFGGVPSGIPTPIEVPVSEQVHLKVLRQKSEQVILYMGGIGPSTRDEGAKNFEVAVTSWGTIPNSRLFLSAREREGLVYQIQSFYTGHVQTGLWGVLTSVSKQKFPELMKVLHEELDRLHAEPLNEMEIMRGVSVLKTNLFTKLQQPDYFLRVLGRREAFRETIYPNDLVRQYELALPERIQTWVQDYVRPLDLSYVVMGDVGADDVLQAINR